MVAADRTERRGFAATLIGVERQEWPAVILAFFYFFLVLAAYYVLRPVREQLRRLVCKPCCRSTPRPSSSRWC
jgi:ATP/ADP translocase